LARKRQYAKVYTDTYDDEWFVRLPGSKRGMYLQMIVLAKKQGSGGVIFSHSVRDFASKLANHHTTVANFVSELATQGKVLIQKGPEEGYTVTLLNYHKHQSDTPDFTKRKVAKSASKLAKITPENRNSNIEQEQGEQKTPAPIIPDVEISDEDPANLKAFDAWKKDGGFVFIRKTLRDLFVTIYKGTDEDYLRGAHVEFVRTEIGKMRAWLRANEEAWYDNWRGFVQRWLNGAVNDLKKKSARYTPISVEKEKTHYRRKPDDTFGAAKEIVEKTSNELKEEK